MKAGQRVVVRELGADPGAAIETLALEEQAPPDIDALAASDVVVRVESAQVGWVDLLMTSGTYQHVPEVPYTPGLEYAGVVAWAGPDAGFREGERVLVDGFQAGPRSSGAYQQYGGFATYAVAPTRAVKRIPGTLDFDEACNLLGNYETAYHCLVARGRLAAGETVLVHGASGATGLAAVHIAKLVGATVIATGRSPEKLAVVAREGADRTIRGGDLREQVKTLTDGRGVDAVYDGVGGPAITESIRALRFGGRYLIVGWAATPAGASPIPTNLVMMKGIDVLGCPTVISTAKDPSIRPPRLAHIWAWAEAGQLRPHISHRFALADVRDAMRAKWRGEVIGGCVVHPGAP